MKPLQWFTDILTQIKWLQRHHTFHLQVLVALRAVSGEIDGGIVFDELTDAIEGLASSDLVLEDD